MYSLREFVDGHGQESVLINNRRSIFKFSLQSNRIPFVVYQIKPSNRYVSNTTPEQCQSLPKRELLKMWFCQNSGWSFLNLAKNTEGKKIGTKWINPPSPLFSCLEYLFWLFWWLTNDEWSIQHQWWLWRWWWGWRWVRWLAKAFVEWSSQRQWCRGLLVQPPNKAAWQVPLLRHIFPDILFCFW